MVDFFAFIATATNTEPVHISTLVDLQAFKHSTGANIVRRVFQEFQEKPFQQMQE